jgi:hypothetical protein
MKKDDIIKGMIIPNDLLKKKGFKPEFFSYYVDAIITKKNETIVFPKCKAIESDEDETLYFTEGDNSILLFRLSENPNMKIKKILLN